MPSGGALKRSRPCFSQWMAVTFGALLTEFRENARTIQEQQNLIEAVEMEMMWGSHRNPRKAYAAVIKRREDPDPAIWHEVQEAYATRNLDRLETLLALTEIQGGTSGG